MERDSKDNKTNKPKKKAGSIVAPKYRPSATRVPALFATYHPRADANQTFLPSICLADSAIPIN
jgi:hypothetical protein